MERSWGADKCAVIDAIMKKRYADEEDEEDVHPTPAKKQKLVKNLTICETAKVKYPYL